MMCFDCKVLYLIWGKNHLIWGWVDIPSCHLPSLSPSCRWLVTTLPDSLQQCFSSKVAVGGRHKVAKSSDHKMYMKPTG